MKISEVENIEHSHGTIALLKLSTNSANELKSWCNNNNIKSIDKNEFHCTVLYSRKPVPELVSANSASINIKASITGWKILKEALTLELNSPAANKLHDYFISKGGTHDFPSFICHLTIEYGDITTVPNVVPSFDLIFDKIEVKAINPNYVDETTPDE